MGKISPVAAKYIVSASINIEGIVDRPDVIGAIFGQTEGLLGADLELRELQRSGRIGRIEVNVDTKNGKSQGSILIPSSLDKAETAIVGAALEIIQRIGPCNALIKVQRIEDVRVSKRAFVIERAKQLLKNLMDDAMPDSQELADEVSQSVRVMEVVEYGKDKLAAGPAVSESEEVIVVEGRADVICLLKHGFKNAIALNGTSVPQTIIELSKKKEVTIFVDGDRGGDLIIKEMLMVAEVDFVAKAPDGKEVEEITKKEIHKALRSKIPAEQAEQEIAKLNGEFNKSSNQRPQFKQTIQRSEPAQRAPQKPYQRAAAPPVRRVAQPKVLSDSEKASFKQMLEDLVGTRGAYLLDKDLNILGKVPSTELQTTVKNLGSGIYALVLDGPVDVDLVNTASRIGVKFIIGATVTAKSERVNLLTAKNL